MFIKFIGDWKKLIPMGYKFNRLYASNYICYSKGEINSHIWIWKGAKDVCINDLHGDSYLVLQYLIKTNFAKAEKYNTFVIDMDNKAVEEYDFKKHHEVSVFGIDKINEVSEEELALFGEKYRKVFLSENMINIIKELYINHMIIITE